MQGGVGNVHSASAATHQLAPARAAARKRRAMPVVDGSSLSTEPSQQRGPLSGDRAANNDDEMAESEDSSQPGRLVLAPVLNAARRPAQFARTSAATATFMGECARALQVGLHMAQSSNWERAHRVSKSALALLGKVVESQDNLRQAVKAGRKPNGEQPSGSKRDSSSSSSTSSTSSSTTRPAGSAEEPQLLQQQQPQPQQQQPQQPQQEEQQQPQPQQPQQPQQEEQQHPQHRSSRRRSRRSRSRCRGSSDGSSGILSPTGTTIVKSKCSAPTPPAAPGAHRGATQPRQPSRTQVGSPPHGSPSLMPPLPGLTSKSRGGPPAVPSAPSFGFAKKAGAPPPPRPPKQGARSSGCSKRRAASISSRGSSSDSSSEVAGDGADSEHSAPEVSGDVGRAEPKAIRTPGQGRIIVAPRPRGPSISTRRHKLRCDSEEELKDGQERAGINLFFGSLVLCGVEKSFSESWIEIVRMRQEAVLVVSFEPGVQLDEVTRASHLRRLVRNTRFLALPTEGCVGAILWNPERISAVQQKASVECGKCISSVFDVRLSARAILGQRRQSNSGAAASELSVVVGGVFSRVPGGRIGGYWPEQFRNQLRDMVLQHRVRVLAGVIDANAVDVAKVLRGCGAAGDGVLGLGLNTAQNAVVTHPHYIVIFGPGQIAQGEVADQPVLPEAWNKALHSPPPQRCTRLAHFQLPWDQRPTWTTLKEDEKKELGTASWPHLNKVVFKPQEQHMLREEGHMLFIHIDSKKRACGKGCHKRKKKRQKRRRLEAEAVLAAAGTRGGTRPPPPPSEAQPAPPQAPPQAPPLAHLPAQPLPPPPQPPPAPAQAHPAPPPAPGPPQAPPLAHPPAQPLPPPPQPPPAPAQAHPAPPPAPGPPHLHAPSQTPPLLRSALHPLPPPTPKAMPRGMLSRPPGMPKMMSSPGYDAAVQAEQRRTAHGQTGPAQRPEMAKPQPTQPAAPWRSRSRRSPRHRRSPQPAARPTPRDGEAAAPWRRRSRGTRKGTTSPRWRNAQPQRRPQQQPQQPPQQPPASPAEGRSPSTASTSVCWESD